MRAHALVNSADPQWQYVLAAQAWPTITIKDVADGAYDVSWFDPQRATWQPSVVVNASSGGIMLDVPDFAYDMAVKITRQD